MEGSIAQMQREEAERLAAQPNTEVLEVKYASINDPWPAARLRKVCDRLMKRVLEEFSADASDFLVRKTCLDDEEILTFYRSHPKLYTMLTDRKLLNDPKKPAQTVLNGFLDLRQTIDSGIVAEGKEADAMANKIVMSCLHPVSSTK